MKLKFFLATLLSFTLLLTACKSDPEIEDPPVIIPPTTDKEWVLSVEANIIPIQDAEESIYSVQKIWDESDKIGSFQISGTTIYPKTHFDLDIVASSRGENGMAAMFTKKDKVDEGDYIFYYPADAATYNGEESKLEFNLPAIQQQVGETADHVLQYSIYTGDARVELRADDQNDEIKFQNMFSVVEFPIILSEPGFEPIHITGLTIETVKEDEGFSLSPLWAFDTSHGKTLVDYDNNISKKISIELDKEYEITDEDTFTVTMVLPPIFSSSLRLVVSTAEGEYTTETFSSVFRAGMFHTLDNIVVDPYEIVPIPGPFDIDILAKVRGFADSDLQKLWGSSDKIGSYGITEGGDWSVINSNYYEYETTASSTAEATFSSTEQVNYGEYIYFYPADAATVSVGTSGVGFSLSSTQTQNGTGTDHLLNNSVFVGDKHIFAEPDYNKATIEFENLFGVLELPFKLTTESAEELIISSLIISSATSESIFELKPTWYYNAEDGETSVVFEGGAEQTMTLTVTDAPSLSPSDVFTARILVPEFSVDELAVTILLGDEGSTTSSYNSVSVKRGEIVTLETEEIDPVGITGKRLITNHQEWVEAVQETAGEPVANFVLGNDLTLTTESPIPSIPLIIGSDGHTLTLDLSTVQPTVYDYLTNGVAYPEYFFPTSLTLSGTNLNILGDNLIFRGTNLTTSGETHISGGIRYSFSGEFSNSGTVTLPVNTVFYCGRLTNNGLINSNGLLDCGTLGSQGTIIGNEPAIAGQLINSSFEDWYQGPSKVAVVYNGTAWFPGLDSDNIYWGTGNYATSAAYKVNPTSPETDHVKEGSTAAKIVSGYYPRNNLIPAKFVAGNIFTGKYLSLSGMSGVNLQFGTEHQGHPVAITGYYDYRGGLINYDNDKAVSNPSEYDSWNIYVALATKYYSVDTASGNGYPNLLEDEEIVAYGELTSSEVTSDYNQFRINLLYKQTDLVPTYLIVVATSSKEGGAYKGMNGAQLYLDAIELEY